MPTPDELRQLLTSQTGDPDQPTAGQHLWDSLIAAGITPTININSAGRAICIDLPDSTTIWVTEQADTTHLPTDHEAWSAIHYFDPDDSGAYHHLYQGTIGLGLHADTDAVTEAVTTWITAQTSFGAVARHNAYLALPKMILRDARQGAWELDYGAPGFNGRHPTSATERHTPTTLERQLDNGPQRRGACLACTWEGPVRRNHNAAVEDALDHTHPGWRALPALPHGASGKNATRLAAHRNATHPPDWFTTGGPLKVFTRTANEWHEHGRAPGGGYLVKIHQPARTSPDTPEQPTLL
ncbi:DUF6349 family protein [Kitasatospora cineracea]|uniref:DUF6349 family protein n=1 Tax=Kitasatospora cineracea TaxID=88074 RepID=UPI0033C4CC56